MACGPCAKKRAARNSPITKNNLLGGYKYLNNKQLKARLEIYKKQNCKNCDDRYECDYGMFRNCKKNK